MAKEYAKSFYNSKAWQKCRAAYIAERITIDGGMCEKCHEQPGYIVHHKIILTHENINNPDITLNFENLMFECKDCHDREEAHAFVSRSDLLVEFNENGDVIRKLSPPCLKTGLSER